MTPTIPTGTAAGDLMILTVVSKYDDASLGTDPAGWTSLGGVNNTGRSTGNDNGNMRERVFVRVFQTGDTAPTLTPTPNNVSIAKIDTYRSGTGAFAYAGELLVDDTAGSPAAITATSTLGLTAGDWLHIDLCINGDVATFGTPTFSATGATFSAAQSLTDSTTTSGTDLRYRRVHYSVSSGTATGNPSYSLTLAGTTTNTVAVGAMVRLRETAPAYTGSAAFGGSGTVDDTSVLIATSVQVGTSGDGNLTNEGQLQALGPGDLTGSGTLTAAGLPEVPVAVDLSGSGNLTATGVPTFSGAFGTPVNLVATAVSATQIDLTWDAVSEATGYDIERDGVIIVLDHPTASYSDTGLTPSTQYTYRVRAVK